MPYYVYRTTPQKRLTCLAKFETYREARALAREQRAALSTDDDSKIEMIFAASEEQADKLLRTPREARPLGEDA